MIPKMTCAHRRIRAAVATLKKHPWPPAYHRPALPGSVVELGGLPLYGAGGEAVAQPGQELLRFGAAVIAEVSAGE